jgi:uncharacterized protein DUF4136
MKMRLINRSALVAMAGCLLLFWFALAAAQDVRYNYLPGTDFSKYKTYKWVQVPNAQYPNDIVDAQIKSAIDRQLTMKGLNRTEAETADLYLTYQVAVTQEKQWNAYSTGGGAWGWGRWGGWGGMQTATATSSTINVGTLNLDFYDVVTKQQVWRGDVSKTLGSGKDPQKVQKNLDKAMAKLLKNYPPPVKK